VVVLAEMTNVFTLLLPLLGVAMIGCFIGELFGAQPIYERLLEVSREKAE
jgi:H+/Cl- antiporter ClcA